jgi:hypothetical protein
MKEATIMRLITPMRVGQALLIAAVVLVVLAPGAHAMPVLEPGGTVATAPDAFERYATAHPYGQGIVNVTTPDWFERQAAAQQQSPAILDGRSPDTLDAATNAALQVLDGRSPDTLDAAANAGLQVLDGRSPDTIDAAQVTQPIEIVQSTGFRWNDAGIGAGLGVATSILLALGGMFFVLRRGHRVQTT